MQFVTMADSKYFRTVIFSVRQSARHYPGRSFTLYDWGFTEQQRGELRAEPGVDLRHWSDRLVSVDRIIPPRSRLRRFVRKHILRDADLRIPRAQWQKELLLDEKCYCLLDAATRLQPPFLFLDADAFIVNRVDELFDGTSDIVVTLRPQHEIAAARRRGSLADINSGVIAFGGDRETTVAFIIEWIKEMNALNLQRHLLSEQTALSRLILRADPRAFDTTERRVDMAIGGLPIRGRIVTTERYNYNSVEQGFDPEVNRILHLKGGRGFRSALDEVRAILERHTEGPGGA
jgi:hypothetical protein